MENQQSTKKVKHAGPNIGKYKLTAHDDALNSEFIKYEDFCNSGVSAFGHDYIVYRAIENYPELQHNANKLLIKAKFAWLRNIRIIRQVNILFALLRAEQDRISKIPECDRVRQLPITAEMIALEETLEDLKLEAIAYGVDISGYLDTSNDDDDIKECTNSWNQDQKKEAGAASDYVHFVKDKDGVWWVLVITRVNGPGRNTYALPGGFKEPNETFSEAGCREGNEETTLSDIENYTIENIVVLEPIHSFWHDPRGKFPYGMWNGVYVVKYIFF